MSIYKAPTYRSSSGIFNSNHHPAKMAGKGINMEVFESSGLKPAPEPVAEPEPVPEPVPEIVEEIYNGLVEVGFIAPEPEPEPENKILVIYEDIPNIDLEIEELPQ